MLKLKYENRFIQLLKNKLDDNKQRSEDARKKELGDAYQRYKDSLEEAMNILGYDQSSDSLAQGIIKSMEISLLDSSIRYVIPQLIFTQFSNIEKYFIEKIIAFNKWELVNENSKTEISKHKYIWIKDDVNITRRNLYNLLYKYNGADIIFENDVAFKKKGIIEILMGAICSSPDSSAKWQVQIDEKPKAFLFKGRITILTKLSESYLKKHKKYEYLIRDMNIIGHE